MRTRTFAAAWLIAAGLVAVVRPRPAMAQQQQGTLTKTDSSGAVNPTAAKPTATKPATPANPVLLVPGLSGAVDFGARAFVKDLTPQQRAGFEMYKTLSSGAVLNDLSLRYAPIDGLQTFQLSGHKIGELDQTVAFRGNQPGKFDLNAKWDQIPHTFSTTARMLGSRPTPDYFSLAGTPRGDTTTLNSTLRGLTNYLGPVRTEWDVVKLGGAITPTQAWDSKVEYTWTGKNGDRPLGMAFGGPSNNAREILEPVHQQVQDLRLTQGFAQEQYQLLVSYSLSRFQNDYSSVTADNPMLTTDMTTTGSSRGRTSLAPNNLAQTVVGTGGFNLPWRTRVNASASYARWTQDEAFVPSTINSAITSPLLAAVPTSLGAKSTTTTFSAGLTSRPFSPITLTAHARSFDFRDQTAITAMPVTVVNDRSLGAADTADRYPFSRHTADLGVRWRVVNPLSFSAGYGYESMERDQAVRNVARTVERTKRVAADYAALSWLSLRAMYSEAQRLGDGYTQLTTGENVGERRYDEADRNRYRTSFIATVTPIDAIDLSGSFEQGRDAYKNSPFGLQSDNSREVGAELNYSPVSRFSIGGGATWENFDNVIRQQYKTGTQTNNATYVWQDNNVDRVATAYGSLMVVVLPNKLDAGGTFEWSKARWHMNTINPNGTPTGGTATQNTAATAFDFPVVTQTLQPVSVYVRQQYTPDWALTLRFQTELFSQNDFRTTNLAPALGNFVYLGNNMLPYNAQFLTLTLSYRPGAIRIGRSTL